jgi:hypothetical protein
MVLMNSHEELQYTGLILVLAIAATNKASLDNAVYPRAEAAVAKVCYSSVLLPRLLSVPRHTILLALDSVLLPSRLFLLECNSSRVEVPFRE